MRLATFIVNNMESILHEWEDFARSLGAVTSTMDSIALRNHAELILEAIAADMETPQSAAQQKAKSHGDHAERPSHPHDAIAKSHGSVRALDGFTLDQMVSEFRAMRASVLRLWAKERARLGIAPSSVDAFEEQVRFNEAVDEALTDSIHTFAMQADQMFANRARRRMESMGALAAGLGHDMANVLVPMRACLDTLVTRGVSEETSPAVEGIRRAMNHLAGLTRGLRAFSMDPENTAAFPEHTVLHEWWATAISPYTWALPKGVQMHVDGLDAQSAPLPAVRVPAHVLMQAVFNLVQNAAQAHLQHHIDQVEPNGAQSPGNIWINTGIESTPGSSDAPVVFLTVRDDGPGMDQATVMRCTDAFFTTKSRNLGSGLGLYVVRSVLERHGAKLRVESRVGVGTTFTLLLPIAEPNATIETPSSRSGSKNART